jgi:hypothetical protein
MLLAANRRDYVGMYGQRAVADAAAVGMYGWHAVAGHAVANPAAPATPLGLARAG